MSDRSKVANARPVGTSGVSHFGGQVYQQHERDAAWIGYQRDRTILDMINDPVIGSVLGAIETLVRRVDWTVQPADESDTAGEYATFVETCLADMDGHWPGDTLAQILSFLGWGWACQEITYKQRLGRNPGGKLPKSTYSDGRIGWKGWDLRPQMTRYGWEFERDGVTALIQQDPITFQRYTIPLAKCILFQFTSKDNSPEGSTPLRVAFDAWYYKRQIQRIEAVGIERDLAGLPVMRIPASDITENTTVYTAAMAIVSNIRNDTSAGVVLPSDRDDAGNLYQDLELLSSGGTRAFDTDKVIRRYANEVVMAFLANVMRAGQDSVGSLALSSTQSDLFQQSIGAHLDTIADTIYEQAIIPLMEVNGYDPTLAPKLVHGDIENADLERMGAYIVNLANAGVLLDTPEIRAFVHKIAGLPVPEQEELEELLEGEEFERELNRGAFDDLYRRSQQPPPPGDGEGEPETEEEDAA